MLRTGAPTTAGPPPLGRSTPSSGARHPPPVLPGALLQTQLPSGPPPLAGRTHLYCGMNRPAFRMLVIIVEDGGRLWLLTHSPGGFREHPIASTRAHPALERGGHGAATREIGRGWRSCSCPV